MTEPSQQPGMQFPVHDRVIAGATRSAVNLSRLDLVSLRLAVCCAEMDSISAAAAACHFSVMGASERLRRLEDAFGRALFYRGRRGVAPTEAGQVLVAHGKSILSSVERMAAAVSSAPASSGPHKPNTGRRASLLGHTAAE